MSRKRSVSQRATASLLGALLALTAQGVIGLGGLARATSPEVSPQLVPPSGQTAVKSGDSVEFGGTVSPGATVQSASLRFHRPDGSVKEELFASVKVESAPLGAWRLTGSKRLPSQGTDMNEGWIVLVVTAENDQGERTTGLSNTLTIDTIDPRIDATLLTSEDLVEVRFSEPVFNPPTEDAVLEWQVDGHHHASDGTVPVESISIPDGRRDRRVLVLRTAPQDFSQDQDGTPAVNYRPISQSTGLPLIGVYRDRAGRPLVGRETTARDKVRPPTPPTIVSIAGQAIGEEPVIGSDGTPEIVISGLREQGPAGPHKGRIYLETGLAEGFQDSGENADALIGQAVAESGGTATVSTDEALGERLADGQHVLYAVAADRALCSPPSGTQECPNLSDSAPPATYVLDRVAPVPVYAAVEEDFSSSVIKVRFSEGLTPDGPAGIWTVRKAGQPTPVTVTAIDSYTEIDPGDTRLLTLEGEQVDLHEAFTVEWAPAVDDAYTDFAGNVLAGFAPLEVSFGVPPVLSEIPQDVLSPQHPKLVGSSPYTLTGRISEGLSEDTVIEVFAGLSTDGDPVATAAAAWPQGTFAVKIPLPGDGEHAFSVRARRQTQDVAGRPVGVFLELDATKPVISSLSIGPDQIVRGGEENVEISWAVEDANLMTVNLFWRAAPGAPRATIDTNVINDGLHEWRVPENVNSENAVIELTAQDGAGNLSVRFTDPFIIDSIAPTFSAKTVDERHVDVRFSELVSGTTDTSEWLINGLPVDGLDKTILSDLQIIRLTAHESQRIPSNVQRDDIKVTYQHLTAPISTPTTRFADRAGNQLKMEDFLGEHVPLDEVPIDLPRATEFAADGIAPGGATLNPVPALVDRGGTALTGVGDGSAGNQIVAQRVAPSTATYLSPINADGSFSVFAALAQDAVNVYRVHVEDPSGNGSGVRQVVLTEDSSGPLVTVKDRKKRIRAKKKALVAQWTSVEPHPGFSALYLEFRKRNGRTRMLTIADQTVDDGREKVRFPKNLRKKMRKGKIKAIRFHVYSFDVLGHVGSDTGRWVKVRGKRRRR